MIQASPEMLALDIASEKGKVALDLCSHARGDLIHDTVGIGLSM